MIAMNLNSAASFGVPRGFPLRLVASNDSVLSGVIPPGVASVTTTLATETGTANAHLALCTMPTSATSATGSDLAVVVQADLLGVTTKAGQSLTVVVPLAALPCCYVVRCWVDGITGKVADTISRDAVTTTTSEPQIPTGVIVASIVVT